MDKFKEIFEAIKADPQNEKYTNEGIELEADPRHAEIIINLPLRLYVN